MKCICMQYNVFWNPDFVASKYAFDTTRKSGSSPQPSGGAIQRSPWVDPEAFTQQTIQLIGAIHSAEYVKAVNFGAPARLAESRGIRLGPRGPTMAVAHSAGLVAAVTEVMTGPSQVAGSLSSGLHHAVAERALSFCTFNGLAVATRVGLDLGLASAC